jgi:hypothetical protein
MKESQRAYVYRVFLALAPVTVIYGLVEQGAVGLWVAVAGAVLAIPSGLATANTSTKNDTP